jgi:hypothetical protein
MTPISILVALVFWASLWGVLGAVMAVPLLGVRIAPFATDVSPASTPFPLILICDGLRLCADSENYA